MVEEMYEPKRLANNLDLAFAGAKQGKGVKATVLTARDILAPEYDFESERPSLSQFALDGSEAEACKQRLKRHSSFIAFPRNSKRAIFTIIANHDHEIIPDDSIVFIASHRCLHASYLCSSFFRVWFEYFQLLRKDRFDFIAAFETFPFPEKKSYNSAQDNYFSYLSHALEKGISIEHAYDQIHSGMFGEKFAQMAVIDQEIADQYRLPKKYLHDKAKILDCLFNASKKLETQEAG